MSESGGSLSLNAKIALQTGVCGAIGLEIIVQPYSR